MTRLHLTPWAELDHLTRRMARAAAPANGAARSEAAWTPRVSVEENEEALLLAAELPGMRPGDVELQVENNVLTLRGEKREERTEAREDRRYHLWERSFGTFQRSFTLPRTVRAEEITAEFENGLLRVRLPKAPEARSRRIPIGGGEPAQVGEETREAR